jgi:hypothetical protein
MSRSKYNPFWGNYIELIHTTLNKVVVSGRAEKLLFPDITNFGQRKRWVGRVALSDGEIISGGEMAHMKSLGKIIAPFTNDYPEIAFRFSMNNQCELTFNVETAQIKQPIIEISNDTGKELPIPDKCVELHQYVWMLQRYSYPINWGELPRNGIYFQFENGEEAHGGDRIVRVGTHLQANRLALRIKSHFNGTRLNSIFRSHVGDALGSKHGGEIEEGEISDYIQKNISFSVITCGNSKVEREDLERKAIDKISSCRQHSPSSKWLGYHSPKPAINASGLWNIRGVNIAVPSPTNQLNYPVLILIPCSARKNLYNETSFSPEDDESIFEYLPADTEYTLTGGRAAVESIASIEQNAVSQYSLDLYDGFMYRTAGFKSSVLDFLKQGIGQFGIISGGYGLVLPNEKIYKYNCRLSDSKNIWLKYGLPYIVSDFAATIKARHIVGFFGRSTEYAKLIRKVRWLHDDLESVRIYHPTPDGKGGYLKRTPSFLGKAVTLFLQSKCDFWSLINFRAEGMEIDISRLYP